MKFLSGIVLFFLFSIISIFGQNQDNVKYIQDPRVDTLLMNFTKVNQTDPGIKGWRIEIFFEAGNYSKKQAMEAKSKFVEKYPEIPSYLIFKQPYYKVRIGDYRTKMDAEKVLEDISNDYPNAFVVTDDINYPRLD